MSPLWTVGFSILHVTKITPQVTQPHEPGTVNCSYSYPVMIELDRGPPKVAHVNECVWCMGDDIVTPFQIFLMSPKVFDRFEIEGCQRVGNVPVLIAPQPLPLFPRHLAH